MRYTPPRKAAIIKALDAGTLTQEDAVHIYALSKEEADTWRTAITNKGLNGLRVRVRK